MASAHSKKGSPYWYAWYRNADGRRVSKATGLLVSETPRNKAEKVADELERTAAKARQGSLTADRARQCVSDIFQIVSGEALLFYSVETWLKDWLANKKASKARATMDSYRVVVNGFLDHLGGRAKISLDLITPRDITGYRDGLIRAKKSPQTANSYVKMLRIPFNVARKQGLVSSNPAEAVDALPSDRKERLTFTPEQVGKLIETAEKLSMNDWAGIIRFGFYTGQRLSDIANLRWENIELVATFPHLKLKQGKTGRHVAVPLVPELSAYVLTLPASDDPQAFLFPELAGKGTGGDYGLSSRFAGIMEKAGFAADLARGADGGRKLAALSFHCLRHTFNSIMANEGVASDVRQKLTGHASEEVHQRYTHHDLSTLRKAVDVLPAVSTKPKAK